MKKTLVFKKWNSPPQSSGVSIGNYLLIAASGGEYNPRDPSTRLGISSTK